MEILHYFEPILPLLPCVQQPQSYISSRQKTIYTAVTLFVYLICCQIPLYGVQRSEGSDPFYWMRVILASNRGTLMQLGLSPIISAGWILQLLMGTKIIKVDMNNPNDRRLYSGVSKLLSLVLCFGQAFAYILSGSYGQLSQIGYGNALLILFQLTASGVIVVLLDEMLEAGYGLGSGISLFIAANMCQFIFWRTFSPVTIKTEFGTEFQGSFIALIHFLLTKPSATSAFYMSFFRTSAPNLSSLLSTIAIFFLVIYLQGFRVMLKLTNQRSKGYEMNYPIKLFYTSNISVIFQSAFVSNIAFLSQLLYKRYKGSFLINLLGEWQLVQGTWVPVGGIAYYISSPNSFNQFVYNPVRSATYTVFVMICCAIFSRFWLQISKQSPKDIAERLRDQSYIIAGQRQASLFKTFNKYIPTAAVCGGMVIGLVTIVSDLMGAIGSGTGILLSVTIIYGYFEKIANEKKDNEITF